jgi:hypothetical protein
MVSSNFDNATRINDKGDTSVPGHNPPPWSLATHLVMFNKVPGPWSCHPLVTTVI